MIEFLKIATLLVTIVSFVLMCLLFTKLRETKVFRFVVGEFAIVTAIAYGFQTALGIGWFSPFELVAWFAIGSVQFARATFGMTEYMQIFLARPSK